MTDTTDTQPDVDEPDELGFWMQRFRQAATAGNDAAMDSAQARIDAIRAEKPTMTDTNLDDARLTDLTRDARVAMTDLDVSAHHAATVVVRDSDFVPVSDKVEVVAEITRRLTEEDI